MMDDNTIYGLGTCDRPPEFIVPVIPLDRLYSIRIYIVIYDSIILAI